MYEISHLNFSLSENFNLVSKYFSDTGEVYANRIIIAEMKIGIVRACSLKIYIYIYILYT